MKHIFLFDTHGILAYGSGMNSIPFDWAGFLGQPITNFGNHVFTLGELIGVVFLLGFVLAIVFCIILVQRAKQRAVAQAAALERTRDAEAKMNDLVSSQNELNGKIESMSSIFAAHQGDLIRSVDERLDKISGRLGSTITDTNQKTNESLSHLKERLAVIDTAQNNITGLTEQVVELQNILANKQTRGAFGEARMQAIVQDGLPIGSYEFQHTLSNGKRPDCVIFMPNNSPVLAIDAKFPLESWNLFRDAQSPDEIKATSKAFTRDLEIHLKAISDKYLISGETQDTAFMFVPSESIFADIHEKHESLIQKAHRMRVVIVSPSLLMLSIQVIQSILKDTRMREQAHLIQGEVSRLMDDLSRLEDRVGKLDSHFTLAQKDVEQILISSEKINKHGARISGLDFQSDTQAKVE